MRRYVTSALVIAAVGAPVARADFVVKISPDHAPASAPAPQDAAPDASAPAPAETSKPPVATAAGHRGTVEPRFVVAQGFGDRVPLRFAVRQIVPRAIKVTYGPGADPDALVDWKGGQGWNSVLARAVHPLGLRLVMNSLAVQIRR